MSISFRQLRVFVTVAQEKTITASSSILFLSKPAISMALSEFEKQLGYHVFERVNNRLLLNEQGKRLLPLADELLTRSHSLLHSSGNHQEFQGNIKIGASNTIGNQLIPFLLRDFRNETQHRAQRLVINNSQAIIEQLFAFELDIGFIEGRGDNISSIEKQDLILLPWLSDEMRIVCAYHHPLAAKPMPSIQDIEQQDWILREIGSGTREHFVTHLATQLRQWNIGFELQNTEAIINCAIAGLGLAYLSKLSAKHAIENKQLHCLNIHLNLHRQYWIAFHKRKYMSPLLQKFIDFAQSWQPLE